MLGTLDTRKQQLKVADCRFVCTRHECYSASSRFVSGATRVGFAGQSVKLVGLMDSDEVQRFRIVFDLNTCHHSSFAFNAWAQERKFKGDFDQHRFCYRIKSL